MTTYIDLASLGPAARRRAEELGIGGLLVPEGWRFEVLLQATAEDTVYCGPMALDFWRKLPPGARLYSVTDIDTADAGRIDTWEEWVGVQAGLGRTDARRYLAEPPQTQVHKHYQLWRSAMMRALAIIGQSYHTERLPAFEELESTSITISLPYVWTLVDDDPSAVAWAGKQFERAARASERVGLDVETDVILEHPNEMHDVLVGVAVAFGEEVYYGSWEDDGWRALLLRYAGTLNWVGHNSKYDYSVLRRYLPRAAILAWLRSLGVEPVDPTSREGLVRCRLTNPQSIDGACTSGAARYGPLTSARFLPVRLSTTETAIVVTIGSKTWSYSLEASTVGAMPPKANSADTITGDPTSISLSALIVAARNRVGDFAADPVQAVELQINVGLLARYVPLSSVIGPPVGDSLLLAYLLGVPEAALKKLVRDRYNTQMITYGEVAGTGKNRMPMSAIDPSVIAPYCCFTPDARVLTRDLRWVALADVREGDTLVGFTEQGKRMTDAVVTHRHVEERPVFRVVFSDGTVLCVTSDHPILARQGQGRQAYSWRSLRQNLRWAARFIEPWEYDDSREAGWFAGFLDGEGYLKRSKDQHRSVGWAQLPGAVADRALAFAKARGFDGLAWLQEGLVKWQLRGGWRETLRLLGSVRPTRLINNWTPYSGRLGSTPVEVVSVRSIGRRRVVSIETSCGTYIVEGFGVHNCGDAYWALRATDDLEASLQPQQRQLYDVDLRLSHIVADMQAQGVSFDRDQAIVLAAETKQSMDRIARAVDDLAVASGFVNAPRTWVCTGCRNGKNKRLTCSECKGVGKFSEHQPINLSSSSPQVANYLHQHLQLPVQAVTDGGQPSVDALALLRLRHEHVSVPLILLWRQRQKLLGYLLSWIRWSEGDGRLRSVITLGRTRSGRFSSIDPNLQQVKLEWRRLFVAGEGRLLLAADYGQIEVRIPAMVSKDPGLVAAMTADPDSYEGDIHGQNVERLFGVSCEKQKEPGFDKALRTRAKNFMFGAIYGSDGKEIRPVLEKKLLEDDQADLTVPSEREIHASIMQLRDSYPVYFYEWVPAAIEKCRAQDGWVYTIFGRPRYLPDMLSPDKYLRKHAERQCISHIIQGTAADIMRFALDNLAVYLRGFPELALLLSVHDEVVIEGPEGSLAEHIPAIERIMLLDQPLKPIPLTVAINSGKTWYNCHS